MSSFEIDILALLRSDRKFLLETSVSSLSKSSVNVGKFSVGKHNKLKSEFSAFKLSLFSDFRLKCISEFDEIFLKISYKTLADVVVLPSSSIFKSDISSLNRMSKSVAKIVSLLFLTSNKTFDKIGKVFFFQQRPVQNLMILEVNPF